LADGVSVTVEGRLEAFIEVAGGVQREGGGEACGTISSPSSGLGGIKGHSQL